MIRTLMGATAALALLASSGAFAATTTPATTTTPAAQTAPVQPAQAQQAEPAPIGQPQIQAKAAAPADSAKTQKVAVHHKYRDVIGDRETVALNNLEASGYFSVLIPGQAARPFRDDGAPLFRSIVAQHSD